MAEQGMVVPPGSVITIDGPAGVGKSFMAKRLAGALGVAYLDTGAMFRATALHLGQGGWNLPEEELAARLQGMSFALTGSGPETGLLLNDRPVGQEIRTEEVGMWASNIATLAVVRDCQKAAQQALGQSTSLVAEGRDMGTVVFPKALVKFFLDAAPEERAKRRFRQLKAMGRPADLAELTLAITARDEQDRNRAVAPLKAADDAVVVDSTNLDKQQVFDLLLRHVKEAL